MLEKSVNVNGINIYSLLNPNLRSFCLCLYIRAGSIFETSADNGISHFFEHIVFRNIKSKYENFYEQLSLHGIDVQARTYKEFIQFEINGPSYEFPFGADVLCHIFDKIDISKEEFLKERNRIKAEIREDYDRASLDNYFNRLVWNGTEVEKGILGYCKVLDRISLKKLNEFRKEVFSKDNFFIYITGNVFEKDIEVLNEKVEKLDIQQNESQRINTITMNERFFNRTGKVEVKNDYWHYIKFGFDFDTEKISGGVIDILYCVLFKCENALVYNYLSEDNPIIYSYDSTQEQYDNIANLNFKFEVSKAKLIDAIKIVVELLNDVKYGKFNFEAALKLETSTVDMDLDKPCNLNWGMAYYNHILKTTPIDYTDELYGRFKGVTKEQVMSVAKEIFQTKNMTVAIKGNKKKINTGEIEGILKNLDI
ncbi:MAG: insulinase family protein [Acutalibacteraceae bacterium]|nr:insulinase family protein [Acutalibacteraceae bacterium]